MDTKYLVGIVIIIIVLIGGYALFAHPAAAPSTIPDSAVLPPGDANATSSEGTNANAGASVGVSASIGTGVTVAYTSSGFSPSTVTIKQGQSVTFVDQTGNSMWIASDPHPVHTGYDGTAEQQHCAAGYAGAAPFDECAAGRSFTFTFDKIGTWGYHNHFDAGTHGTVVVTP